ncbi:uncharacterized protein M421DRAFT_414934 [Didymella exigua CBS 183.55]|uniref:Transmembrane protein n=1 Tax=Didymella exigua CBS 183.55 TaxID=1150837 RepID=A0A6A5S1W5_9PLEO|nr:uncharacterized protein M421DRAFT_414934 [Didymella exigua CBS 183.55]KAF1933883.1 hypothetical protein M421DRAFT_414934 [Didymella exigua CBS 183.55]
MSSAAYHNPSEQHASHGYQPPDNTPYSQPYHNYSSLPSQSYADVQGPLHSQACADQYGVSPAPTADATSIASGRPSETKPASESHVLQTPSLHTDLDSLGKTHLLSQRNDFYLDWAIKILGVAAAVTFGIWAPISYKITADGNNGNDKAQASLMSAISSMSDEAATAATAQKSAVTVLEKVQDQLENLGLLRAWEFCDGRTEAVCIQLQASSKEVLDALSSLGGMTPKFSSTAATSTFSAGATSTNASEEVSASMRLNKTALMAVILGSVFGGIVIIGLVVGVMAKRRRNMQSGH